MFSLISGWLRNPGAMLDRYASSVPAVRHQAGDTTEAAIQSYPEDSACNMSVVYGTAWKKDATTTLVQHALASGYRALDTAAQPRHYREDLVGEGVRAAIAQGLVTRNQIKVGRFPYAGNGKALALGTSQGLVKTIFDAKTGALLGAHMIGFGVPELIHGFTIGRTLEATEQELMHTIFPHPTLSEMIHESVLSADGVALHI